MAKDKKYLIYSIIFLFAALSLASIMISTQGCAITKTLDWRKLDTPIKRYHYAQLSFEDMQKDYIAMFPRQPEETQAYLRKDVAPVMHKCKLALGAWGEVITEGKINTGQESKFTVLYDDMILLLKPYLVRKEGKE